MLLLNLVVTFLAGARVTCSLKLGSRLGLWFLCSSIHKENC